MNHLPSPEDIAFDQGEENEEIDEFKELQDFFSSESAILNQLAELDLEDDEEDDLNWSDELEDDWSLESDIETDNPITEEDFDRWDKIELFDHQDPPLTTLYRIPLGIAGNGL